MEKYILQYLVFNENGTDVIEANALILDSEAELNETANIMIENYHNAPEMKDLGLVLMNNTNGTMLYNSKEEK